MCLLLGLCSTTLALLSGALLLAWHGRRAPWQRRTKATQDRGAGAGPLLAAVLLRVPIGTLTRLGAAADSRQRQAPAEGDGGARAGPRRASTAAILTFDCDGRIRSCNRALGDLFAPAGELVGTSFGRLLDVPEHDQPRLFRRSDGPLRALIGRRRNGQRIQLHASLSSLEWRGERVRAAVLTMSGAAGRPRAVWR